MGVLANLRISEEKGLFLRFLDFPGVLRTLKQIQATITLSALQRDLSEFIIRGFGWELGAAKMARLSSEFSVFSPSQQPSTKKTSPPKILAFLVQKVRDQINLQQILTR